MALLTNCSQNFKRSIPRLTVGPRRILQIRNGFSLATSSENADHASTTNRDEFWRRVPVWSGVTEREFLSYGWSVKNIVEGQAKLHHFLANTIPKYVPLDANTSALQSRDELLEDVYKGAEAATMSIRLTQDIYYKHSDRPYILSRIDWNNPRNDPVFRQFIPLKSVMLPDHPRTNLDSLEEEADSPTEGLVHRYPDKALFLATSVCPTYCTYCTRARAVGANTDTVTKCSLKPGRKRWEAAFEYIATHSELEDIVVSGGDSFYLQPEQLKMIGERLLSMANIRRIRFASKGLAVSPNRFLDRNDDWTDALISVSNEAKELGKSVALHTHFNHPNEISWVTQIACQRLLEAGVTVRNQSVLLRGVNDNVQTMSRLIRTLAHNNIMPYYVYQCDMVERVEHLRTPLQTILDLEARIRGSISGFMMPQFVVDLPGGGGKRLACSFNTYDRSTGKSTFVAPAVTGRNKENKVFEYHDPVDCPHN